MVLNILLAGFLLNFAFAQTSGNERSIQIPTSVKVADQKESPLLITILDADNSSSSYQKITYTLKNVSNKPVRAFSILSDKVTSINFTAAPFQPGDVRSDDLFIANQTAKQAVNNFLLKTPALPRAERGNNE
jgi:hypothetical protein